MNATRLVLIPLFLATACTLNVEDPRNPGNDGPSPENPSVEVFDRVDNQTDGHLILVAEDNWTNPDAKWEASCTSSDLDILVFDVEDGLLTVRATDALLGADCDILVRAEPVREILVTGNGDLDVDGLIRDLAFVETRGDGEITFGTVQTQSLGIEAHGNGQIKIDNLQADSLKTTVGGRGDVWLAGAVPDVELYITDLGDFIGEDLMIKDLYVELTGGGNALVNVSGTISGKVSGDGNLDVFGNPEGDVDQTGSGHVIFH